MSHLIFNLRRICRIALPRLLFFSLQWNCWTLFVDLNFPVHAGIHTRRGGGWGMGEEAVVNIAGRCGAHKASHHFSETKENGRERGEKTREARETVGGGGEKKSRPPPQSRIFCASPFYPVTSRCCFFFLSRLFLLFSPCVIESSNLNLSFVVVSRAIFPIRSGKGSLRASSHRSSVLIVRLSGAKNLIFFYLI